MSINSSSLSLISQQNYLAANNGVSSSLEKMATGSRINRGADDPAGMITSEQLSAVLAALAAQSSGMEQTDAVANVADGALSQVSSLLGDANAAAVANANTGGMSQDELDANQLVIDSALQSVDRVASTTTFDGQSVLDGSMTLTAGEASQPITSVATGDIGQTNINGTSYTLADVMSGGALDSSHGDAAGAQQAISAAMSQVATLRGQIGAFQQDTIEPMMRSNSVAFENTAAALSQIRDTNYAAESANLARGRALQSRSSWVLALANSDPRRVLEMLG